MMDIYRLCTPPTIEFPADKSIHQTIYLFSHEGELSVSLWGHTISVTSTNTGLNAIYYVSTSTINLTTQLKISKYYID